MAWAENVRLMGFDVDGVLTDGALYYGSQGDEMKAFSVLDGHGLKMLASGGIEIAIISGRSSRALEIRAQDLGIKHLFMGVDDKRSVMANLLQGLKLDFSQAGYMGDDVVDLSILRACGFSATVPGGHPLVKQHVNYVSNASGGHGAVREVCELILKNQGRLDAIMARYLD